MPPKKSTTAASTKKAAPAAAAAPAHVSYIGMSNSTQRRRTAIA